MSAINRVTEVQSKIREPPLDPPETKRPSRDWNRVAKWSALAVLVTMGIGVCFDGWVRHVTVLIMASIATLLAETIAVSGDWDRTAPVWWNLLVWVLLFAALATLVALATWIAGHA
jgi:hypothetical protein